MIRQATDDDWPAILDVHRRAFGGDDVPRLVEELQAEGLLVQSFAFVAESAGDIVGNVLNGWVGVEGSSCGCCS